MALQGEIVNNGGADIVCDECNTSLPMKVCRSNAGYYIGYFCPYCGPYSRESSYFRTMESAEAELIIWKATGASETARDTEFHPGTLTVVQSVSYEALLQDFMAA